MATWMHSNFACDPSVRKEKARVVAEAATEAPADDDGSAPPEHVGIEASFRSKTRDKLTQSRRVIKHHVDDNCQERQALSQKVTIEENKVRHRAEMEEASIVLPRIFGAQGATRPAANQSLKDHMARRMHASGNGSSTSAVTRAGLGVKAL